MRELASALQALIRHSSGNRNKKLRYPPILIAIAVREDAVEQPKALRNRSLFSTPWAEVNSIVRPE